MKYLQKSFTFAMSDAVISQEDWDAIFGKKDAQRGRASVRPSTDETRSPGPRGREAAQRPAGR